MERRAQRGPRRRLARVGARHHDRPAVRLQPAGGALRRRGRDLRPGRPRGRRWRRVDDPGADGLLGRRRPAVRPGGARALPRRAGLRRRRAGAVQPGRRRRDDRRSAGGCPAPSSTSTRWPATSGPPPRRTPARSTPRSRRSARSAPTRASAGTPRWPAWPSCRPRSRPDGVVTAGSASQISDGAAALAITTSEWARRARADAAGPHPHRRRGRRRPGDHAHRADPGHREGAAPRGAEHRRHRGVRGERGVRAGAAGVAGRDRGRPGAAQPARRRDRARSPARRAPAPGS